MGKYFKKIKRVETVQTNVYITWYYTFFGIVYLIKFKHLKTKWNYGNN